MALNSLFYELHAPELDDAGHEVVVAHSGAHEIVLLLLRRATFWA